MSTLGYSPAIFHCRITSTKSPSDPGSCQILNSFKTISGKKALQKSDFPGYGRIWSSQKATWEIFESCNKNKEQVRAARSPSKNRFEFLRVEWFRTQLNHNNWPIGLSSLKYHTAFFLISYFPILKLSKQVDGLEQIASKFLAIKMPGSDSGFLGLTSWHALAHHQLHMARSITHLSNDNNDKSSNKNLSKTCFSSQGSLSICMSLRSKSQSRSSEPSHWKFTVSASFW